MHPCLKIVEILRLVCDFVYYDDHGPKDIVALAATCQAFYNPACDVLWHTLPSLAPLVRCMSADTWQLVNRTVSLRRATTSEDWAPCKPYARRLRRLGFALRFGEDIVRHPVMKNQKVDYHVIQVLSLNHAITFPNLREFRGKEDHLPYIGLFLGPSLHSVEFSLPAEDPHFIVSSILDSFRTVAPNLKRFRLFDTRKSGPTRTFVGPVEMLARLEVLNCRRYILPPLAVRTLAASSTLHTLKVANTGEDIVSSLPEGPPPFQQLTNLVITTRNLRQCSKLFDRMHPRHLRRLDISTTYLPVALEVLHFFEVLETHCAHSHLGRLEILQKTSNGSPTPLETSDAHIISPTVVAPLLAFGNLHSLTIDFQCAFQLDDLSFKKMAMAWPEMIDFQYGCTKSWARDGAMSLDGFISIAKHWPHVTSVRIPCNPTSRKLSSRRPGGGAICASLEYLDVKSSVFTAEPAIVASFLTDLFPNLTDVFLRASLVEVEFQWEQVNHLLPVFRGTRMQERQFALEQM
ncbi:hypothetical protein FPV67DRAFT_1531941 [Lyophyllum atratum]|nr:hypothetical protein FPV67DRAFT_1531941 [Lyophyllum atratum]